MITKETIEKSIEQCTNDNGADLVLKALMVEVLINIRDELKRFNDAALAEYGERISIRVTEGQA